MIDDDTGAIKKTWVNITIIIPQPSRKHNTLYFVICIPGGITNNLIYKVSERRSETATKIQKFYKNRQPSLDFARDTK